MDEMKSPDPDTRPQENPLKAILQYAALPLTLITALFYLFGYVHYIAYLSYWGLPEGIFPLTKYQSVISGLFQSLLFSSTILSKMLLAMIVLLAAMIATIISAYRPFSERLSSLLSQVKAKAVSFLHKNVVITPLQDKSIGIYSLIGAGIVIFVILLAAVAFPCKWIADQAKESARKEHLNILAGKVARGTRFSSRAIFSVKNDSKVFDVYSGHMIQISATHAALYDKNRGMMIFPLANVAKIAISENRGD